MPQVADIVLANGEGTPSNHTFVPLGQNPATGFWHFEDQSPRVASSSPLGWPRISVRARRANDAAPGENAQGRINRVELNIALPQLESLGTSDSGLTPPATIAYVDRVKIEFLLPSRNIVADRKDALAFAANLLADDNTVDLVENLTQLYG